MVTVSNHALLYPAGKNVPLWFMFFLHLWILFWYRVPSLTTFTRKSSQPGFWGKEWRKRRMPLAQATKKLPTKQRATTFMSLDPS